MRGELVSMTNAMSASLSYIHVSVWNAKNVYSWRPDIIVALAQLALNSLSWSLKHLF